MIGVLVTAYGGPNALDEVEPYLLDVRGGRPTSAEIIHEVSERYREIGGRSPILERTRAQAAALEAALNEGGQRYQAFVGMRHWHPYIADTLAEMAAAGMTRAVGLVMAPHYSRLSIGAYFKKVDEAHSPLQVARIERWHLLPGYLEALAERVRAGLCRFPAGEAVHVIFTAHSLPQRILEWNDPYPDELRATMVAVLERLGPDAPPSEFAYQSAAIPTPHRSGEQVTPDPWLGPHAGEVIARLAREGVRHVLIAPIGFVCEHVEILYDVDVVFSRQAASLGVRLERIEMLNTAPPMISGLAELVQATAHAAGWL